MLLPKLIIYILITLFVIMLLLGITYKQNLSGKFELNLNFSLTIVCMLFLSPLGWSYYYVLLIIPLVVTSHLSRRQDNKFLFGLTIIAWILCSVPHQQITGQNIRPIDILAWAGFPFYGLMLFLSILILLTWKLRNNIQNANLGAGNL